MVTMTASPSRFTAVASDLHLSDFEEPDPRRPGWRRFKHRGVYGDSRLLALLAHLREQAGGDRVELVLAGDVFDFDTIVAVPEPAPFPVSWLERMRGLDAEEPKSVWKMERILAAHPEVVAALAAWVRDGNELVFIVGNHDLDLHWPAVQATLVAAVGGTTPERVSICEFFRIAGGDTLIMHGNQFDAYCVCQDPLHPFIEVDGRPRVRAPFGNVAGKLMLNGMGYFNPHVESSFIRPLADYVTFFFRYIVRHQPLLGWSWLWSACVTLWVTLDEGFRPARKDPLEVEARVEDAARRARATPAMVRTLREFMVHSAVFSPLRVARELWLDRAALLVLLMVAAFQVGSTLRWFGDVGPVWIGVVFLGLLPAFFAYARSCRSEVGNTEVNMHRFLGRLARAAGVRRVVMGHTHRAGTTEVDGVLFLNTGHWSSAFDDVECEKPVGTNGFVWVDRAHEAGAQAELRAFDGVGSARHEAPPERLPEVLTWVEAGVGTAA